MTSQYLNAYRSPPLCIPETKIGSKIASFLFNPEQLYLSAAKFLRNNIIRIGSKR